MEGTTAFEKLEGAITEIRKDLSQMAKSLAVMEVKLEAVSKDTDELKNTPKKRWDAVIAALIAALVGAFVGFIIKTTVT